MQLSARFKNFVLLAVSTLVVLGVSEILLRMALFSDLIKAECIRKAGYFADFYFDDNVVRLKLAWSIKTLHDFSPPSDYDPVLGWKIPESENNPLGLVTDKKYSIEEYQNKPVILFFGNSFVAGYTATEDQIPQDLERRLSGVRVLNFGVRGYGLDQIYLKMKRVIDRFDSRHIFIGLFYHDIDRCLYRVRKPYFEISGGELVLRGVPIPADVKKWPEFYPVRIRCYTYAAFKGLIRRLLETRWGIRYLFRWHPSESKKRLGEKKAIARKIIESIKAETDRRNARLTFVLFPFPYHLIHDGWYEKFLKGVFKDLEIDYLDMKVPLKSYLEHKGLVWWKDLYKLPKAHPCRMENRAMVGYIADYIIKKYGYQPAPKSRMRKKIR